MPKATPIARPPDRRGPVRPILFLLVFAAFLFIVGVTASGQAALVTSDSSNALMDASVGADVAIVRSFVGLNLHQADLQPGGLSADRQATLQHGLQLLTDGSGILRAALLAPDGTVLKTYSAMDASKHVATMMDALKTWRETHKA